MDERAHEILKRHALELWQAFVDGDPDLMSTDCGCCAEKRDLVKRIRAEMEVAGVR